MSNYPNGGYYYAGVYQQPTTNQSRNTSTEGYQTDLIEPASGTSQPAANQAGSATTQTSGTYQVSNSTYNYAGTSTGQAMPTYPGAANGPQGYPAASNQTPQYAPPATQPTGAGATYPATQQQPAAGSPYYPAGYYQQNYNPYGRQ